MISVKIKQNFNEDNCVLKWVSFKRNVSSCAFVFLMASALDDTKNIRGIQMTIGPKTGRRPKPSSFYKIIKKGAQCKQIIGNLGNNLGRSRIFTNRISCFPHSFIVCYSYALGIL
jgi:hypothetical protein